MPCVNLKRCIGDARPSATSAVRLERAEESWANIGCFTVSRKSCSCNFRARPRASSLDPLKTRCLILVEGWLAHHSAVGVERTGVSEGGIACASAIILDFCWTHFSAKTDKAEMPEPVLCADGVEATVAVPREHSSSPAAAGTGLGTRGFRDAASVVRPRFDFRGRFVTPDRVVNS
jgi:hypothetical protein